MNFIIVPPKRETIHYSGTHFYFSANNDHETDFWPGILSVHDMFRGICVCFAYLGMFETKLR